MKPLVTVGGKAIPEPSTYSATTATVVDSGRNVKGVFVGAIIREDTAKIELTWKWISAEDWANIAKMFNSRYGGAFINHVNFYNQDINEWETRNMYVSDRTAKLFLRNPDNTMRGYTDARLALIEI